MATPWNKIKADYLTGITPRELAKKYNLTAKSISEKACVEKWTQEKTKISKKIQQDVQEKIKENIKFGSDLAVSTLIEIIQNKKATRLEKISASKAILEVSGLKTSKTETTISGELKQSLVQFVD